jgi:hypothetical protein
MDETEHASVAIAMRSIDFIFMVISLLDCAKIVAFPITFCALAMAGLHTTNAQFLH